MAIRFVPSCNKIFRDQTWGPDTNVTKMHAVIYFILVQRSIRLSINYMRSHYLLLCMYIYTLTHFVSSVVKTRLDSCIKSVYFHYMYSIVL